MLAVANPALENASFDIFNGETPESVIARALGEAVERLGGERLRVAARPFSPRNFLGIPQAGEDELLVVPMEQNRGAENDMFVMKGDAIVGWEVTPPGQNAFVSADGTRSEHYDDQLEMYYRFGKKRMWFYPDDVETNKKSELTLTY